MKFVIALVLFVGATAHAESKNYFVESMTCEGQWNKPPPQYHSDYERAGIRVTSFWSTRRDCTLAASSATEPAYAPIGEKIKFSGPAVLGYWFEGPLKIDGDKVQAPYGVWGNPVQLTVTGSSTVNGVQTDMLEGRDNLSADYYYDLKCTATVVDRPKHIENLTANCP